MASIDGIALTASDAPMSSGAGFVLAAPSPVTDQIVIDGREIALSTGSRYVVVRGGRDLDYTTALRSGLTFALRGLDFISARGAADLTMPKAAETHLVWYPENTGLVVRICDTTAIGFSATATAVVTDAEGNIRPDPPKPPAHWHESMRYYRHAQLADDVMDALRNLWLATENLLDSIDPQAASDSEAVWLKRALSTAATRIDLTHYIPQTAKTPVNEAYKYFYDDLRTHLFHAKGSRQPSLPAEATTVNQDLIERHDRLTRLYIDLLNAATGVQRSGGGLTYAGFELIAKNLVPGSYLHFTDDTSEGTPEDTQINPTGGQVVSAIAHRDAGLSRPGRVVLVSEVPGEQISPIATIRRYGVCHGTDLLASVAIDGQLDLAGAALLVGQYAFRMRNLQQPASFIAF